MRLSFYSGLVLFAVSAEGSLLNAKNTLAQSRALALAEAQTVVSATNESEASCVVSADLEMESELASVSPDKFY